MDKALGDKIPEFNRQAAADEPGIAQLSSFGLGGSRTHLETAVIALVAVVIVGGAEVLLRILNVPQYIMRSRARSSSHCIRSGPSSGRIF